MTYRISRWWACASVVAILASGCTRTPDTYLTSARVHLESHDPAGALVQLKNLLELQPGHGEGRLLMGTVLLELEQPGAALVELRKAVELKAAEDEVAPAIARALLATGQAAEAADVDRTAQLSQPRAVAALKVVAAQAHLALGQLDRAEVAARAALRALPDYAPAELLEARLLLRQRRFEPALQRVGAVLARTPDDPDALTLEGGLLQIGRGDSAGAARSYQRALEVRPRHLAAHSARLTQLLDANDLAGARRQLDALTQVWPGHFQTRYFEARLLAQSGDLRGALGLVQHLLRSAPASPPVLQLAGAVSLRLGNLAQAEGHLTQLLQQVPGSRAGTQLLARVHLRSGDPAKALATLEPLLAPGNPDAHTLLIAGNAHLALGDLRRAEQAFARAAELEPADLSARTALAMSKLSGTDAGVGLLELQAIADKDAGTAADLALIAGHVGQRRLDAALASIAQLDRKSPGRPLAPYLRAQVQMLKADLKGARASLEQAVAADPDYFAAIDALAALDLRERKPERARARYAALLKARPEDVRALLGLAAMDALEGKLKEVVVASLDKAVALQPTQPAVHRRLVQHHMAQQDFKRAMDAAQVAVGHLPKDADMLVLLAAAQLAAGEPHQAVASYNQLVALRPRSAAMLVGLAEAQLARKSDDAARETIAKALSLAPSSVQALQSAVKINVKTGHPEQALKLARSLQARSPESALGWVFEGDVELARGNGSAAARAFRVALQRQRSSSSAERLHVALRAGGDRSQAEAFEADWLKEHPKDVAFRAYVASWAIVDRKQGRAEAVLEELLQIDPLNGPAWNNLAWVRASAGKPGAVAAARKANELIPNQSVYLDTLAFALAAEGDLPGAVRAQRVAVHLSPAAHGLRLQLARLYLRVGDKSAAREELETLARLGPGFGEQAAVSELRSKL